MPVGQLDHLAAVEDERLAGGDREAGRAGLDHGLDGGDADDRHIEAHVLAGLGDLDDREAAAPERAGAADAGVGPLHRLDGDAGPGADDDGLPQVEARDLARDLEPVLDVAPLARGGGAPGEDALPRQVVPDEVGRVDELYPFAGELRGDTADEGVGVAARQRHQHPEHPHVRERPAEDLHVLDLPGHDRLLHALALEEADHPPQLADADPLDALGHALDAGVGLLPDGHHRQLRPSPPRALDDQEGELAVARDQTVTHKMEG